MTSHRLGTLDASETVLKELYIDLRSALRRWASITFQTPQARMGYIGQHLTSVVTGFPGGRSGARGKDLILPDGHHAEIKTCYRVDQLGKCLSCTAVVASIEIACPVCGSDRLKRNDDSKWLIGIRNEAEMRTLFDPRYYYLVLFDFADFTAAVDINARIYEVDPNTKGFAYCMTDYYVNIAPNSTAPFNLWPFQLKFETMKPRLIYHSVIREDDTINTIIFPGVRGAPVVVAPRPLTDYARSQNLSATSIKAIGQRLGVAMPNSTDKRQLLSVLEENRYALAWDDGLLADELAEALYADRLQGHRDWLPTALR